MNIEKYKELLNHENEFICINYEDFKMPTKERGIFKAFLFVIFYLISILILLSISPVLLIIVAIMIFVCSAACHQEKEENYEKVVNDIKEKVEEHNLQIFNSELDKEINNLCISNVEKEIEIAHDTYFKEKIIIDDKNKIFAYVNFKYNNDGSKVSKSISVNYSDIIRYSFVDNSIIEQSAVSKTSSNSGKSIAGAITSGILVGNATLGAVVGGSGERTTNTTYKTVKKASYQVIIFLNKLNNSTLTIKSTSGNCINEIISCLEYIIKNK